MDQKTYRQSAIDAVRKLSVDVGIPTKLDALTEKELPFLCESAFKDACTPGNPKSATISDYEAMFKKLM
jgi:lactaldehyde reductase